MAIKIRQSGTICSCNVCGKVSNYKQPERIFDIGFFITGGNQGSIVHLCDECMADLVAKLVKAERLYNGV